MMMSEKAELALRMVRESKDLAYDTETSGLDWKRNWPVGYVITSPEKSLYIPVRHGGGGNLMDPECGPLLDAAQPSSPIHLFETELAAAFKDRTRYGLRTVGHNLKFDAHFSARVGIMLGRHLYDTEIQAALLDEYIRSFSLANCCTRWGATPKLGDELYDYLHRQFGGKEGRDSMGNFWRAPGNEPVVVDYAEGDGISTLELHQKQMEAIQEEEMGLVHQVESDLIWTVFRMEHKGVKVDLTRADALLTELANQVATIKSKFPADFNPRSPVSMRTLMEEHGHTDWPMTSPSKRFPEGQSSFNEKWLKTKPVGKLIIDLRQKTNLKSSFIDPLINTHTFEGRVFSSFNQMKGDEYGTISGRFSSSQPNMQQVPKRNKELGRLFRELFIPDDGMKFVEADYSQCEPRLFAHYSGDEALLSGYNATPFRDMHQVVSEMLDVERDPTAKRMNMGLLTGMQKRTFAAHMEYDLETASREFDRWMRAFPGIANFQNLAKNVFRQRGHVRTLLGRRCRLDDARFAYRGTSRIIQGGNADIIKYKMLEVDLYLESIEDAANLLLTVHDSFGWQTPDGEPGDRIDAEIVKICENVQVDPFNLRVPFVMDVGKGTNWGEATYGPAK